MDKETWMDSLKTFVLSSNGRVEPVEGLRLGWLGVALGSVGVIAAVPTESSAHNCYGIPLDTCDYVCTDDGQCPQTEYVAWKYVCHRSEDPHCQETFLHCGC